MAKRFHKSKKMKHMKYDTLRHERDRFNDEHHHDAEPVKSGPYHYDRQVLDKAEYYGGARGKRAQERADAGMIHENHAAIANLPQEVMIKPYPRPAYYLPEDLDDTLGGIDRQIEFDAEKKMQHFYPKKV